MIFAAMQVSFDDRRGSSWGGRSREKLARPRGFSNLRPLPSEAAATQFLTYPSGNNASSRLSFSVIVSGRGAPNWTIGAFEILPARQSRTGQMAISNK
jgi:hypothetical protein